MIDWPLLLFIVIATEAITEILIQSRLFFNVRHWLSTKSELLAYFVNCGYCMSMWVASVLSLLCVINVSKFIMINLFISSIIIHRLSNITHIAIKAVERYRNAPTEVNISED